jgi:hypothetical protein
MPNRISPVCSADGDVSVPLAVRDEMGKDVTAVPAPPLYPSGMIAEAAVATT